MAEYIVIQRQTGEQCYTVEAKSQADAVRRVQGGEGEVLGFDIVATGGWRAVVTKPTDSGPT